MVEATEQKYAKDDSDACVFECLLPTPVEESSSPEDTSFTLPSRNEVVLLTRWGTVVHAPVAPETAQQTQVMADGPYHGENQVEQEASYARRDTFLLVSSKVDLAAFERARFTSLQACQVAAEVWQYCHGGLDPRAPYPAFPQR